MHKLTSNFSIVYQVAIDASSYHSNQEKDESSSELISPSSSSSSSENSFSSSSTSSTSPSSKSPSFDRARSCDDSKKDKVDHKMALWSPFAASYLKKQKTSPTEFFKMSVSQTSTGELQIQFYSVDSKLQIKMDTIQLLFDINATEKSLRLQLLTYLTDTHLQPVLSTILNEFRAALFQESDIGIKKWNYGLSFVLKDIFKNKTEREKLFRLCTFKESVRETC